MRFKKGESEASGSVIWIVVIIIAAIIIALFVFNAFGILDNLLGNTPESLAQATEACELVLRSSTVSAYCDQFRNVDISGESQSVNCQHPEIEKNLDISTPLECTVTGYADYAGALSYIERGEVECIRQFRAGKVKEDTKINDVLCSQRTCEDLDGELVENAANKNTACDDNREKSKEVFQGFRQATNNNVCCVRA